MRPVAATGSWLSSGANRLRTDALSIVEWVISSARPVFDELATALEQTAVALERHDRDLAFNAVQQARAMGHDGPCSAWILPSATSGCSLALPSRSPGAGRRPRRSWCSRCRS